MHSPLASNLSFSEAIKAAEGGPDANQDLNNNNSGGGQNKFSETKKDGDESSAINKSLALMVQPSVDYGKFNSLLD